MSETQALSRHGWWRACLDDRSRRSVARPPAAAGAVTIGIGDRDAASTRLARQTGVAALDASARRQAAFIPSRAAPPRGALLARPAEVPGALPLAARDAAGVYRHTDVVHELLTGAARVLTGATDADLPRAARLRLAL